jgi:hypothetical protein
VGDLVSGLDPISLERLDESAALRERVDTKYVIDRGRLAEAADRLSGSYHVLEIDARRSFDYESVYFDTPDLRCFHDHIESRRPRFKARSRSYRETGACFLEIKVKDAQDATTKRQCLYDIADHGRLTDRGRDFIAGQLLELVGEPAAFDLAPTLSTRYRRVTLAAREGGERVTLDLDVRLRAMDNRKLALRDDLALVETKTACGGSAFDAVLLEAGCEATSISKYRLGVGLLLADDPGQAGHERVRQTFV